MRRATINALLSYCMLLCVGSPVVGDHSDHEIKEASPLAHLSMEGKIKGEPIIFREPAELGSNEGRPENPAYDVATSFARCTRPGNRCRWQGCTSGRPSLAATVRQAAT